MMGGMGMNPMMGGTRAWYEPDDGRGTGMNPMMGTAMNPMMGGMSLMTGGMNPMMGGGIEPDDGRGPMMGGGMNPIGWWWMNPMMGGWRYEPDDGWHGRHAPGAALAGSAGGYDFRFQ